MDSENRCPRHAEDPREIWMLNCPACCVQELRRVGEARDARIAELEKELGNARDLVADMECSCLPYAKPGDGMCERCMFFKDSIDGEGE